MDLKDYREAQQKEVKGILDKTKKEIQSAGSEDKIKDLVEDASKQIGEIKTDEQLTAEEAAARQAAARAAKAKKSSKKKSKKKKSKKKNSEGCVGDDAANFY